MKEYETQYRYDPNRTVVGKRSDGKKNAKVFDVDTHWIPIKRREIVWNKKTESYEVVGGWEELEP